MCVRMRRIKVPLPPPEGELMTKSMPRSAAAAGDSTDPALNFSLNVLHLFAQLFHFRFDRERGLFDRHVG